MSSSRVLLGLLFGAVVLVALGLWADGRALMDSFRAFDLRYVAPVLGLTLLNYLIRFGKWHYYLGRLGHHPRPTDSALVFLSGLSMAATPGKLGELVKARLLAARSGVPAADTASVVIAERLTDVLALVLISAGGVVASGRGVFVLVSALVLIGGVVAVTASDFLAGRIFGLLRRMPKLAGLVPKLESFRSASLQLVRPGPLLVATVLSVLAWGCECVGYHLVLVALPDTSPSLPTAAFIYAFATVFGAVTFLPGGLLATEGSLIGLSGAVFGLAATREAATAGALLIRFATLWFGVLVGFCAWGVFARTTTTASPVGDASHTPESATPIPAGTSRRE
ncbi:MAG: flippase-like domain-containing protein [Myxococcales bacterium]|nr:flippase-like domain-containing protein [Myxococcales bacterium]